MQLTTEQKQAIKADIAANTNTIGGVQIKDLPNNSDANFDIANWYNATASPDFYVWKTSVGITEIMQNGFGWDRVDNLTVGKARIWEFMTAAVTVNPSLPNVRAGFIATFTTAGDLTTRQAIFNHSQRLASRVEKLLASGSGTTSNDQGVGPATMGAEGPVSYSEIEAARVS